MRKKQKVKNTPKAATRREKRHRQYIRQCNIPKAKQAQVVGLSLTGASHRKISAILQINRETVTRILSQEEVQMLVNGYREAVVERIVPEALIGLYHHVTHLDRTAIIETLYGARVLIDRHEVATVDEAPKRTYDSTRVIFYGKFHRWPKDEELEAFDRTIKRTPLVKGELTE